MITNLGIFSGSLPGITVVPGSTYSFLTTRPFTTNTFVVNTTYEIDRSITDVNALKEVNFDSLMSEIEGKLTTDLNKFENSNTVNGYCQINNLSVKVTDFHEQTPVISYVASITFYIEVV